MQRRNKFGRGPPLLGWDSELIGESVTFSIPWMVESFVRVPPMRNQPLGCPQNPLGFYLGGVTKMPWGAACESAADICWGAAFWGASDTGWGVSIVEIGCPLHSGYYSPQERDERNHVEPGRKGPPSWSALYWRSLRWCRLAKQAWSQGPAPASQSWAMKDEYKAQKE